MLPRREAQFGRGGGTTRSAVPLTSYHGIEQYPSFSPSGDQVAFSWDAGEGHNFDIYVKTLGIETPRRLTSHPASELGPVWSPDGRFLTFVRAPGPRASVVVASRDGGAERTVTEIRSPYPYLLGAPGPLLAWASDGEHVILSDKAPGSDASALYVFDLQSGEKRPLTHPPTSWRGDSSPAFSPDYQTLAFVRWYDIATSEIYMLRVAPDLTPIGEPEPVTQLGRWTHSPAWMPDGRSIVFSSGSWDATSLWISPIKEDSEPRPLAGAGGDALQPTISLKTGAIVYTQYIEDRDIWRIDLTATHRGEAQMSPLITSTRRDVQPRYSPDGRSIVFVSTRSGNMELWLADADGSNPRQLTKFGGPPSSGPSWSPDGRRIVFDNPAEGQMELYLTDWQGRRLRRLTHNPGVDIVPVWSRDGKWIYFSSRRSGSPEIWKMSPETGEAVQVTRRGGFRARESYDGRYLYYTKSEHPNVDIWRMPVQGGTESVVLSSVSRRHWEMGKSGIFYQPGGIENGQKPILFYDFASRKSRVVVPDTGELSMDFALAPDKQTLLVSKPGEPIGDLMILHDESGGDLALE